MKVEIGAEVVDRTGKVVGRVDHLARNTMTAEVTKFIVTRKGNDPDLYVKPDEVAEATPERIKLKRTLEELEAEAPPARKRLD